MTSSFSSFFHPRHTALRRWDWRLWRINNKKREETFFLILEMATRFSELFSNDSDGILSQERRCSTWNRKTERINLTISLILQFHCKSESFIEFRNKFPLRIWDCVAWIHKNWKNIEDSHRKLEDMIFLCANLRSPSNCCVRHIRNRR